MLLSFLLLALGVCAFAAEPFLVEPYLQLGNAPKLESKTELTVLWHTADRDGAWSTEYRLDGKDEWVKAETKQLRRVAPGEPAPVETPAAPVPKAVGPIVRVAAHRVWGAVLRDLPNGKPLRYRISLDGNAVFEAAALSRKSASQDYRFVVTGDIAQGTAEQRAVAFHAYQAKPDFVAVAGDIVYGRGLISEYRTKFFPIYNADKPDAKVGAPLLRSVPFIAAPGNHDVGGNNLGTNPDGLAYFLYWSQPLNGPVASVGATQVLGPEANRGGFRHSAGEQFPRMANFSFDYGNAHWTVIDSNKYADWTADDLREWLKRDLASAKSAKWRFVLFHHPGFNSSKAHFNDQWMRIVAPVFEEGKVDVVFAGHVHNYQRSFPLKFVPEPGAWRNEVKGALSLDKKYDGVKHTKPDGVIYLVTGAGGAKLYNPEQSGATDSWQSFTTKFVSNVNSFTLVDVDGGKATFRQIDKAGNEVDRFVVSH